MRPRLALPILAAALLAVAGCGGSSMPSPAGTGGANPLSAEARSAATGDIPDNQVFLTFHNLAAGYSIRYPEGWAQRGSGNDVTFQDKNNIVRIVVSRGVAPTTASVAGELAKLKSTHPTLRAGQPRAFLVRGGPAIKVRYSTQSKPNPVTGKKVVLVVDRYELSHNGRRALVDLGTPKGVDNVDAYRMMIESFRWR